jgi:pectate lyase
MTTTPTRLNSFTSLYRFPALVLLMVNMALLPNAPAALLFYEGFDYPDGQELGDPAGIPAWENGKSQITIGAGSLQHVGIEAAIGNRMHGAATTASFDGTRTSAGAWPEQSTGVLYCSFLLRVESATGLATTGEGTSVLTIGRTSNSSQMIGVSLLNSEGIKIGVIKYPGGATPSSSAFFTTGVGADVGTGTVLVVAKYEYEDGAENDVVTVWVNPTTTGGTEDPENFVATNTGVDGNKTLGRLTLCRGPNVSIDEIRIGQTWAEVTPTGGPLVASQLGFGQVQQVSFVGQTLHPVIVNVLNPGGVLVPTNGVPVSLSLTVGSGNLNGTLTRLTGPDGRAVFDDLSFDTVGKGIELTATSSLGLSPGIKGNLYVTKDPDAGTVTPPIITETLATAGNVILRGQGTANAEYRVITSTDATQPLPAWTPIATNMFDGSGAFAWTNTLSLLESQRFFSLASAGGGDNARFPHMGYASVPGPITGGGNTADRVVVTNLAGFLAAVSGFGPRIIYVDGTITLRDNGNTYLYGNKTIIGLGTNATLIGCIGIFGFQGDTIYNATNIILRNLHITNPSGYGEDDAITMKNGGGHVWIDHCTIYDSQDGLVDATREADFITVSWCRFYYTAPNGHENVNLIGGDDGDASDVGKLHLTFHHNWYGDLAKERLPSVRYGRVHFFNNYVNTPGNNYATRTRLNAEVLVENNHYENVQNPWELIITSGTTGLLRATGNLTNNCTFTTEYNHNTGGTLVLIDGSDILTDSGTDPLGLNPPPYAYTLDDAADVQTLVTTHAGAGKGPFAP